MLSRTLERFESRYRIGVQVNSPRRSVLCLREFDCLAIKMNLRPGTGVLLTESHSGMDTHHEFGNVFREAFSDNFVKTVVFFLAKEAQAACTFPSLAHQSRGVDGYLPIANPFAVAEGDECLIPVGRRGSLAALPQPTL